MLNFTNDRAIKALAKKNALRWNLVKQVLKLSNKYDRETLESFGTQKLASIVAELKKKK